MSLNDIHSLSHTKWNCKYHNFPPSKNSDRHLWRQLLGSPKLGRSFVAVFIKTISFCFAAVFISCNHIPDFILLMGIICHIAIQSIIENVCIAIKFFLLSCIYASASVTQRYIGIEPRRIEQAIEGHAKLI